MTTSDDDSFEFEGVNYHAIGRKTCQGCAFEKHTYCHFFDEQPTCIASLREDGRDIVWTVKTPC